MNNIGTKNPSGSCNSRNNKVNVERNPGYKRAQETGMEDVQIKDHLAEIQLKSFKTDTETLRYKNGTAIYDNNKLNRNDTEHTYHVSITDQQIIVDERNETDTSDSLNDSTFENDSLGVSSSKETDIEEDSLETGPVLEDRSSFKLKYNAEERMPTYLYGVHIPEPKLSPEPGHLKNSTSFIIPFKSNNHSTLRLSKNNKDKKLLIKSYVQAETFGENTLNSCYPINDKQLSEVGNIKDLNGGNLEPQTDMENPVFKKFAKFMEIKNENEKLSNLALKEKITSSGELFIPQKENHNSCLPSTSLINSNAATAEQSNFFGKREGEECTANELDAIIEVNKEDTKKGIKNIPEHGFTSDNNNDMSKETYEFIPSKEIDGIFKTFNSCRPKSSFNANTKFEGGIYETAKDESNNDCEELDLGCTNSVSEYKSTSTQDLLNSTENVKNSSKFSNENETLSIQMQLGAQYSHGNENRNCKSENTKPINDCKPVSKATIQLSPSEFKKHDKEFKHEDSDNYLSEKLLKRMRAAALIQKSYRYFKSRKLTKDSTKIDSKISYNTYSTRERASSVIQKMFRKYVNRKIGELAVKNPGSSTPNTLLITETLNGATNMHAVENTSSVMANESILRSSSNTEIILKEIVAVDLKAGNTISDETAESKVWTTSKAACVIQNTWRKYLDRDRKEVNTKIPPSTQCVTTVRTLKENTSPSAELHCTPCYTYDKKVNWFIEVEPIEVKLDNTIKPVVLKSNHLEFLNNSFTAPNLVEVVVLSNSYKLAAFINNYGVCMFPDQRNSQKDTDTIFNRNLISRRQDIGKF